MEFQLSRRQEQIREDAAGAIQDVVMPVAEAAPANSPMSADQLRSILRGLAPLGYLGGTLPQEVGGAGMSNLDYGVLIESLAHGPVMLGEYVLPRLLIRVGSDEQLDRWLPALLRGDASSTSAITEPQAGSDLRALTTHARREADQLLLTGRKKWIKFGSCADVMAVLFVADSDQGAQAGTSRLVVERSVSSWLARDLPAVGMRNLSWSEVSFEALPVPLANLLGSDGKASPSFTVGIEASRPFVGLEAVGLADHALQLAIAYVKGRVAFGRTLSRLQAVQLALADAATEVAAARWLCLHALWLLDQGQRCPKEASMAKVFATEVSVRACAAAMEVMGAQGLSEEAGVERCWRDARMLTVIDGASAIQRLVVGRELLGGSAFV